jgi:glucokinase
MAAKQPMAIGIDLGGTNLKGIVMDKEGAYRHLTRVPTEAEKGGKQVMSNILTLIGQLIEKEGSADHLVGVGIGTPGFVDSDGTMLGGAENLPGWKGTQIYAPIKQKYKLPAIAANDVTVMALAESKFGAGKGVRNVVCLAMGTGIGGGIVINGHLYAGTHGMAGELGHTVVETNGIQCTCGLKGCVERYASATGVVYLTKTLAPSFDSDQPSTLMRIALDSPDALTAKMVYDHAKNGDPFALHINDIVCEKLAVAVGIFLNAFAPDRMILGGGLLMAGDIILRNVQKRVPRHCWPQIAERCDIVIARLGEDAGALGSAAMAFDMKG